MKWVMLSGGRQRWKMAYQDSNNKMGLAATSMRPGSMPRSLWCKRTACGPLKKEEGDEAFDPCGKCNPVSNIEVVAHSSGGGHVVSPPYGITVTFDLPLCIEQIMTNGTWVEVVNAITGDIVESAEHLPKLTQSVVFGSDPTNLPFDPNQMYEVKISTLCLVGGHHHTSAHASFLFCFDGDLDPCL